MAADGYSRNVSILFADVVGSTKMIETLDAEEVRDLLDEVIDTVKEAVHLFGGAVARIQGDGVMAVFGMMAAAEDHALRAALAGCRIRDRMMAAKRARSSPSLRVGIHSGAILLRWQDSDFGRVLDAVGATAHVAARVEQHCPPEGVAISSSTLAMIDEPCETSPLQRQADSDAPEMFALHSINLTVGGGFPLKGKTLHPLVGRDEVIARLRSLLRNSGGGAVSALGMVGEPGIGKSRLLNEAADIAFQSGVSPVFVRGSELLEDQPFGALRQVIAKMIKEHALLPKLNSVERLCVTALIEANVDQPVIVAPDDRNKHIRAAIGMMFKSVATRSPVLLLIDDVQYLDGETRAVVGALIAGRIPNLGIVMAGRPEAQRFLSKTGAEQLQLDPLSQDETAVLIDAILGTADTDRAMARAIAERAEGLPLAIEEFSAFALGQKQQGQIPSEYLPLRLDNLFRRRIEALENGPATLCAYCCALGTSVSLPALRKLSMLIGGDIDHAIQVLIDNRILQIDFSGVPRFTHQLLQETGHSGLGRRRRASIHREIFQALAGIEGDPVLSHLDLARHADLGEMPVAALGCLWKACEEAVGLSAIEAVWGIYGRAKVICSRMGVEGQVHAARFALLAFDAMQQLALQDEGREDLLAIADGRLAVPADKVAVATVHLAMLDWISGRPDSAVRFGARGLDLTMAGESIPLRVYANFTVAQLEFATGKPLEAVRRMQHICVMLTELHQVSKFGAMISIPGLMARSFGSWYASDIGELDLADEFANFVFEHGEQLQHNYSRLLARMARGYYLLRSRRAGEATIVLDDARRFCLEYRFAGLEPMSAAWLAIALLRMGRIDEAAEVLAHSRSLGNQDRVRNCCRYYLLEADARLTWRRGDSRAAIGLVEGAIAHAEGQGDLVHSLYGQTLLARFREESGWPAAEVAALRAAVSKRADRIGLKPLVAELTTASAFAD